MILLLSFLAMIVFIPLRSRQHFIPFQELNQCLLADICNHTWIPECGYYGKRKHTRLFIDDCDMYEYNCDNGMRYIFTNYSECFGPATCPSVPSLLTRVQGFYIYYADGRRMLYHPPAGRSQTKHMFPFETTETIVVTRSTNHNERRRYTPEKTRRYKPWTDPPCAPCGRMETQTPLKSKKTISQYWPPLILPPGISFPWATISTKKRTTKRNMESTTKRTMKAKPTTQIIRTGTIGTIILKNVTVWKNGKKLYKVVKASRKRKKKKKERKEASIIPMIDDSDFLE